MEKISIVVPVYNDNEELYHFFLDSVMTYNIHQDYEPILIIVKNKCIAYSSDMYFTLKFWLPSNYDIRVTDDEERCVAASWNYGIKLGQELGAKTHLVFNHDIKLFGNTINDLLSLRKDYDMLSASSMLEDTSRHIAKNMEFSCFLINDSCIDKIGWFDREYQRATYEDIDYFTRAVKAGLKFGSFRQAKYFHHTSLLSRKLKTPLNMNHFMALNHKRFVDKWGLFSESMDDMRDKMHSSQLNSGKALSWWPEQESLKYSIII